jgi:hypothetical protein
VVFWTTNGFRDKGSGWDLSRLEPMLTEGVADRVRNG